MTGPGRRFRLRGELAGRERRFPLPSGEVWIGSARANDVVLPLRGVSRRHARLFVDAEGARLEDLDSKNGVAVNGTQVGQARLEAGDEIRFGPAQLRFEEVDAEDVELAIEVELPERAPLGAHHVGGRRSAVRGGARAPLGRRLPGPAAGVGARRPHGSPRLPAPGPRGGRRLHRRMACPQRRAGGPRRARGAAQSGARRPARASAAGIARVFSAKLDGSPDLAAAVLIAPGSDPARDLDMRLVPHAIPLLERDDLFGDAVRSLRRVAGRCTGQLLDTLLDKAQDPVVRRRIPRVLKAVPTQRAAGGLLMGLRDERPDVRYRCTQALVRIKQQAPGSAMSRQDLIAAALRELGVGRPSGRSLDHVFSILSLALPKEPLEIALQALRSGDETLRGTALEYLENVLPEPVRVRLWPQLGAPPQHAPSGRLTEELRDDLLRSTAGVARLRSESRRRLSS